MKPVDLTLEITPRTPMFPGSPAPQFIQWNALERDGYNLEIAVLSTHTGTHLDAPYHFCSGGARLHQIPVSRLMRRAELIRADSGVITRAGLVRFENEHCTIRDGATVILHTGWSKSIKRPHYFEKNPGLAADAAEYLASKKINLVGIDSPSIDPGSSPDFAAHRILAENDVLIVENLVNLDRIPQPSFDLTVLPLKIRGATGSPVRAVAA